MVAQLTKAFDATDLGADGELRVAYHMAGSASDHERGSSIVYKLSWDEGTFETETVLQHQTIVSLKSTRESDAAYRVYALTNGPRASDSPVPGTENHGHMILSTWRTDCPSVVDLVHIFENGFFPGGLDLGTRGVLVAYASDTASGGQSHDFCFASTDSGRSWRKFDDGFIQGAYFDAEANEQYVVSAYTLKRRKL